MIAERLDRLSASVPWSGCLVWTGAVTHDGYARVNVGGKNLRAHRVAYELRHGPIQRGLVLDHLCRVRCCINPSHLEAVSRAVNNQRGNREHSGKWQAAKTHCPSGHPYSEDNTYLGKKVGRSGNVVASRVCKTCVEKQNKARRGGGAS